MRTLFITKCGKGLHWLGWLIAFVSMPNTFVFMGAGMNELARLFQIEFAVGVVIWIIGIFCVIIGHRIEERNRMNAIAHQPPKIEVVTQN